MEHPTVTLVRGKLHKCRGRYQAVIDKSGVSRSWINHFAAGTIHNPTIDQLQAVSDACDLVLASALPAKLARIKPKPNPDKVESIT